jgi:hypothetical protein
MIKILYRAKDSSQGTAYREGYATYAGTFVKIGSWRGSPWTITYRTSELEIIEQK